MASANPQRELTLRGLVLGALITVVFTASNVYLGLRIGLTFASSIPAAVISMAVLRLMGGGTLLENNMVQSQASAAGTLSCVFATFPGLIIAGFWTHFPFWQTAGLSFAGGVLGVLFTIPLRRALVTQSNLPYPEGVAAAEILRAGADKGNQRGLQALIRGGMLASLFSFFSGGLRLLGDGLSLTASAGSAVFQLSAAFSPALIGAGYLVGLSGGMAMLTGCILAWGVGVPWLTGTLPNPLHLPPAQFAQDIWLHRVRFVGAGAIAVASLWTLIELMPPVLRGIRTMLQRTSGLTTTTERDLSARTMGWLLGLSMLLLAGFFAAFLAPVAHGFWPVVGAAVLFCIVFGFIMAAACGYMAGIVGSSSSPISGIIIIGAVLCALMILGLEALGLTPDAMAADGQKLATAFTILLLSAITATVAISNDNLQDLKTGQLVGATPWKQEVALIAGCLVGAAVIPPVLNLLYQAYGFTGAMPRPGMDPGHALSAPQPALITLIAKGIFTHSLDWSMLSVGMVLGMGLVGLDLALRRRGQALPPLGVAVGLYLPASVSLTLAGGAILGWVLKRVRHKRHQQSATAEQASEDGGSTGTMLASGFIVGESLTGVLLAVLSGATGRDNVFSLAAFVPSGVASVLGALAFAALCWTFARRTLQSH
ncbi:oligopeptide transporter, OPT family [Acetobacter lambici]|uniref:Oligopeptide transporter, OPT family n=1 Tax=Acetobacter lambici TaxID=1332824 RepID=A0ABT1EYL4_9PROT|nr:oligopeptide transporter, OPT family [Acetobacter lambici]MCP1242026.1 oligopeptide transporter, OPT family [Acetobacter lambici]MCP1258042.1 oligopeptide transporter, OPT family [Acetobacter lambici]NHO56659.1 oligopeptide transporter, OPT family [Acetobacter lambici]